MKGKNNPKYKEKILVTCNNCGKKFYRIPSIASLSNKDGEIHNFCCKECYYKFRSKFYVGNKLYNTGKKMPNEFCEKVRQATLQQYSAGILDRQTKPQKIINEILDNDDIKYKNEKIFGYYSLDNYLEQYDLAIEVMGDYFHANPIIYTDYNAINKMQLKDVLRDKSKHTYVSKYHNIEILYLWETDIKNNKELCKKLILEYINKNGKLDDYNSFNFSLVNNKLKLNENIINPYFIDNP